MKYVCLNGCCDVHLGRRNGFDGGNVLTLNGVIGNYQSVADELGKTRNQIERRVSRKQCLRVKRPERESVRARRETEQVFALAQRFNLRPVVRL